MQMQTVLYFPIRIDLTRMECKGESGIDVNLNYCCIDLTIMECKALF